MDRTEQQVKRNAPHTGQGGSVIMNCVKTPEGLHWVGSGEYCGLGKRWRLSPRLHEWDSGFHPQHQHYTQETSGSEGPVGLACGTREGTAATG